MNKLRYRLVFNRARGQVMVVAETARGDGKGGADGGSGAAASAPGLARAEQGMARLRRMTLLLAAAFGATLALAHGAAAQVVADRNAPGNQQPTVLTAANGVIQVNVQTPSAAGVSRNTYSQFDVPQSGVILNNSRSNVQTQLGGYVQANPWLSTGAARVILNEVNSSNPSQIRGYIEVAGPRAEVIVANPAGINVNGGGFINVSRATLTTGTPILNGGALDGYSVQRGIISVDGSGLDASTTDYTNLIARSVAINAGVWAQQLAVTTGANQVNYDNSGVSAGGGSGAAPLFGIDVSQLGGMYANKIILLGTEAGVGVHNAGSIGAAAGEVIVTAAGRLENSGSLAASAALQVNAGGGVANSGNVYSGTSVNLKSGGDLVNSGTIQAGTSLALTAATSLSNSGTVYAGNALAVTAAGGLGNSGTLSGQSGLQVAAGSLANSGLISSGADAVLAIQGEAGNVGGTVQAGHLDFSSATGGIDNSGGKIVQAGSAGLDISAAALVNGAGGTLGAVATAAPASGSGAGSGADAGSGTGGGAGGTGSGADAGSGSTAPADAGSGSGNADSGSGGASGGAATTPVTAPVPNGTLRAATTITNNGGQVSAGGGVSLAVQALDNSGGNLGVDNLSVSGADFSNRLGKLNVQNNFTARTANFGNQGGIVLVGGTFDGQLGRFDNSDGLLQAAQLQLTAADALDNTRGVLRQTATTTAQLSVGGQLNNELGKIETAGDLALTAGAIAGSGGALTTLGNLSLNSGVTSAVNGTWIVSGNASLRSAAFDNGGGSIAVGKNLTAATGALNNMTGDISAGGSLAIASAGALDSRGGYLQAGADLTLDVAGALSNDAGVIETLAAGSAMRVRAQAIDNGVGRIVNVGTAETLIASQGAVVNGGTLAGNGKLAIEAATLQNNTGGSVIGAGQLTLGVTQRLANLGGVISSGGALDFKQASATLVNSGQITSGGALNVAAGAVNNDGGSIATASTSGADVALSAASLSNKGGAIVAAHNASVTLAGAMDNAGGTVQAAQDLQLSAGGALANAGGSIEAIAANSVLNLSAASIANGNGQIVNTGSGATTISSAGAIVSAGLIAGNGNLTLAAQSLSNQTGASLASAAALELAVRQQLDNTGGAISASGALTMDQAGATLNNSGQIVAGGALSLAARQINNDGGQLATIGNSGADVQLRADGLSNKGGAIVSDRDVGIAVTGGVDNDAGSVQAGRDMHLSVGGALANGSGVIEAVGAGSAFTVQAGSIDSSGRIVNVGSGATSVSASHIGNSGTIAGNGALALNAATLENRHGGSISAGQQLDLAVTAGLSNAGSIGSGAALNFAQPAASFINSGQVAAGAGIDIRAASIVNDGGQIATVAGSGANIALNGQSVSNRGGAVLADGNATLASASAFVNDGGTLQAAKNLTLSADGKLSNNAGVVEAIGADSVLAVQAGAIDNLGGRIVNVGTGDASVGSQGDLVSSGQIAGNGNLLLSAQTLQNQAAGSIVAGKALELGVTRQLLNQGSISSTGTLHFDQAAASFSNSGKLVAGAAATIRAASIVNDGGQLATASGSGADLTLAAQTMSNRGGGVFADRSATVSVAGALDNTAGTLQAAKDMQLSAGGALSNDNGVVEAIGAASTLTVQAAALANTAGRIVNVGTGATNVASQSGVVNSGVIAGNGDLNLSARTLQNNAGGSIVAGRALQLGVTQQLDNLGGAISSAGTLTFNQAAAGFNNSGQVVAGGAINIVANQVNNNAGQISTAAGSQAGITLAAQGLSNRGGKIVADGDGALSSAAAVDNTQGVLHAGANLAVTAGGALANDAGTIEAVGASSTLALRGATVDNGSGRIYNVGNGASSIVSQNGIVNNGAIATNGSLTLQGLALQNGAAASVASSGNLNLLLAQQFNNQGSVNSAGTLTFNQAGASMVNSGQLISGGDMTLAAYSINNDGGSIGTGQGSGAAMGIGSQILRNQGGKIVADSDLTVSAQNLQALGAMSAGRDLSLTLGGDYTQTADAQLHANRNLSLTVAGTLTNAGTLEAVGNLALTAGQIGNQAGALIQGQGVAINTGGTLNNAGEINGAAALTINAGSVNNTNSIVGGNLSVTAQTVNNTGAVALLGATSSMGLWVGNTLNNTGSATIYSAGAIAIAASQVRDANGDLASYTGTVNNVSSTIEAAGNLELTASTVNNIRENVVIEKVKTIDETTTMKMPSWWTANAGDAGGNHKAFLTTSSHYHAYEVYFVDPADILEQSTVITPDGNTVTRVVIRTHASDSVFYSAWGGSSGNYGKRSRLAATDGTKVLYYINRMDGQTNPDQGGALAGTSYNYGTVNNWDASDLQLSSGYGSCTTNCVRLVSDLNYTDPTHTILRDQQFNYPGLKDTDGLEQSRIAHHTAVEDQLSASAGAAAQILSGGNMRIVLGQTLNNTYGEIMAGGAYISTGGDTNNTGITLYRTHSFDGIHQYTNAASSTYTAADISEQIGQVGGVISGAQGVYISGRSFNNVDVSAGTVGNVRSGFTVLGSGSSGGSAKGALNGSGDVNHAAAGGNASGAGDANQAALAGNTSGSGLDDGAAVRGPTASHGLISVLLGNVRGGGGASLGADAQAVQAASAGQPGGKANVIKVAPTGLSKQNPDPNGNYLFETRSQFANLSDWISSDYLLQALKLDPATTQKRLGDAFYEQNLVRDQLAELTGRTIASGAASDAKYEAMMTSAVSYAQEWGLRPGIALTAEQVSQLTSDIVWLESQSVSLPDGSVQTVLVPKVYLAHVAGDSVKGSGALVTGDSVVIDVANLTNRGGVIDGGNASGTGRTVLVAANDLVNQGGTIKGNDVVLQAGRDLINQTLTATQSYSTADNRGSYTSVANQASIVATGGLSATAARDVTDVGGSISAGGAASIAAGRDLSFTTAQTGSTFQQVVGVSSMVDSTAGHQLSQLSTGTDLTLSAGRDLTLSGTQVAIGTSGVGDGILVAGRALTVAAVTNASDSDHHGDASSKTNSTAVHNDQNVVGSNIGASGGLVLAAGLSETASLNVTASNVAAGNALMLSATGDVNILSASESHLSETSAKWSSSGFLKKSSTSMADSSASTLAIGSSLAGASVSVTAGNDITIGASQLTAQGALQLSAGRDLTVTTATASSSESHFLDTKKSGVTLDPTHGVGYLSAADKTNQSSESTTQVGSLLSGGSVTAVSGRDTVIQGSTVVADNDLTLAAGRNLSLLSAQNTLSENADSSSKKSGMIGSFGQPAIGTVKSSQDGSSSSVTQVGSQVASLGGDVTISAGEKYTQTSSQVLAPAGDISIAAKDVLINAAFDSATSSQHSEASKVAIGGSANIPVVNAVQGIVGLAQAAKDSGSDRMKGLAAVTAAMQAKDVASGVAGAADTVTKGTGVKVSVSLGSSKSESTTVQTASTAVGSQIAAGGNVSIAATGGGKDSNLTAIGSDISAGGDVSLKADNAISLLAAENTASQHSTNSASSSSIGIGYAFGGSQNGFTLEVAASKARGNADGDDLSYSNTHVSAGGAVALQSGGDTTLKGGVVTGNTVVADIGGNLNIESLQDKTTFDSKQVSGGFGLSLCIPPFCYGASSASVSASKAKVEGDFLSVTEQSGIKAGDGGYQIKVGGNTDLVGAVITSNQAAIDTGKNSLSTASLTYSALQNKDVYEASGFAVSASAGTKLGDQSTASTATQKAAAGSKGGSALPSSGVASASGSQSSVTESGISAGALTITDAAKQAQTGQDVDAAMAGIGRSVTTENAAAQAGALTQAWDGQKLIKQMQAQAAITQAASATATAAVASYIGDQRAALQNSLKGKTEDEKKQIQAQIDDLNNQEHVLNVLIGAVTGNGGSALTKEGLSAAAGEMRQLMIADSKKFAGVVDSDGTILDNHPVGVSDGVRGDGEKVGGVRVDLDLLCGTSNERCVVLSNPDKTPILDADGKTQLVFNEKGQVQFDRDKAGMTMAEFVASPEGQKMSGPTGGIQGEIGTLFGKPYAAGSWQDKLIEAFSGTHDLIGGKLTGLYDAEGKTTRGLTSAQATAYNVWSGAAILPASPFAASEFLPPDVWQTISILLKAAK